MKKITLYFIFLCLLGTEESFSSTSLEGDTWENTKSTNKCMAWQDCRSDCEKAKNNITWIEKNINSIIKSIDEKPIYPIESSKDAYFVVNEDAVKKLHNFQGFLNYKDNIMDNINNIIKK